jgi:hypothetical protein
MAIAPDEKRPPPDAKPLTSTRLNGRFSATHSRPGTNRSCRAALDEARGGVALPLNCPTPRPFVSGMKRRAAAAVRFGGFARAAARRGRAVWRG